MSGTDIAYGRSCCYLPTAKSVKERDAWVAAYPMVLCTRYAMSGTDVRYPARAFTMRCPRMLLSAYAMSSAGIAYPVRYSHSVW
eukprot:1298559-Rhodomonas_salina.1